MPVWLSRVPGWQGERVCVCTSVIVCVCVCVPLRPFEADLLVKRQSWQSPGNVWPRLREYWWELGAKNTHTHTHTNIQSWLGFFSFYLSHICSALSHLSQQFLHFLGLSVFSIPSLFLSLSSVELFAPPTTALTLRLYKAQSNSFSRPSLHFFSSSFTHVMILSLWLSPAHMIYTSNIIDPRVA